MLGDGIDVLQRLLRGVERNKSLQLTDALEGVGVLVIVGVVAQRFDGEFFSLIILRE